MAAVEQRNRRQTIPRSGESSTGRSQRRHPPLSSSASDPLTESSQGITAKDAPLRHQAQRRTEDVSALPHRTSARALRTTFDDVTFDTVAIEPSQLGTTRKHSISLLADDDASQARPPPQRKGTSRRRKPRKPRDHVESAGTGATRSGHDRCQSAGRHGEHQDPLLQKLQRQALELVDRLEGLYHTRNADADRASWRQRPNHNRSSGRPVSTRSTPTKDHRRRIPQPLPSSPVAPTAQGDQTRDTLSEPPELESRSCSVDQGRPSIDAALHSHRDGPPHASAPTAIGPKRRSSRKFLRSLIDKRDAQIRQLQARSRQSVTVATQTEPLYDGYVKDAQCQTQVVDLSHRVAECMNCGSRTSPLDSDRFLRAFGWVDHTAANPQQGYTVAQLQNEFGDPWRDLSVLSHATGISIRWFKEQRHDSRWHFSLLGSTIRKALGKARHPDIDDQERREYGMSLARARGLYGPAQIYDVVIRNDPVDTLPSMFGIGRIVRDRLTGIFYRVLDEYTEPMELGGSSMCTVRREFDYDHSGLLCIRSNTLELVTAEMTSAQWHLNWAAERERAQTIASVVCRADIRSMQCPEELDEWLRRQGWYTMNTLPGLIGQPVHVWDSIEETFSPVMFVASCEPNMRIVEEDWREYEIRYQRSLQGRPHLSRRERRRTEPAECVTRESLAREQHPSLRNCTFRNSDGTTCQNKHGGTLTVPFCQVYVQCSVQHAAVEAVVIHFKRPVFYERYLDTEFNVRRFTNIVDVASWPPTSKLLNDGAPKVYTPPESFPDVTRATVDAILRLTGNYTVVRDHISGLYGGVCLFCPSGAVEIMFLDETRCLRSAGEYTLLNFRPSSSGP